MKVEIAVIGCVYFQCVCSHESGICICYHSKLLRFQNRGVRNIETDSLCCAKPHERQ